MESLPVLGVLLSLFRVQSPAVGPGSEQRNGHESDNERLVSGIVHLVHGQLDAGQLAPGIVCGLTELGPLNELGFTSASLLRLQVSQKLLLLANGFMVLVP